MCEMFWKNENSYRFGQILMTSSEDKSTRGDDSVYYSEYFVKLYTIFVITVYNIITLIEMARLLEMFLGAWS